MSNKNFLHTEYHEVIGNSDVFGYKRLRHREPGPSQTELQEFVSLARYLCNDLTENQDSRGSLGRNVLLNSKRTGNHAPLVVANNRVPIMPGRIDPEFYLDLNQNIQAGIFEYVHKRQLSFLSSAGFVALNILNESIAVLSDGDYLKAKIIRTQEPVIGKHDTDTYYGIKPASARELREKMDWLVGPVFEQSFDRAELSETTYESNVVKPFTDNYFNFGSTRLY